MKPAVLSAMLLAASTILSACSTTPSASDKVTAATSGCLVFQPIYAADADTRSTKNQVAIHNRKGTSLCGWGAGRG